MAVRWRWQSKTVWLRLAGSGMAVAIEECVVPVRWQCDGGTVRRGCCLGLLAMENDGGGVTVVSNSGVAAAPRNGWVGG